jgi:hypothetical protein
MQLSPFAEREPHTDARAQRFGLRELSQAEQVAEEATCLRLAARRRCELDMI